MGNPGSGYGWNTERQKRRRQLVMRLIPLLLSAGISMASFFLAASPAIRQRLDTNAMSTLSGRFHQVVDGYFSPVFQFMSSASLWARIGEIDSLGNPQTYVESMYQGMKSMRSVSRLSMSDSDGRELVLDFLPDGDYRWYETTVNGSDSIIALRNASDVTYLNLGDVVDFSTGWARIPVGFQISTQYLLPGTKLPGTTIRADIGDPGSDYSLDIWLDLPVSGMTEMLLPLEKYSNAVVFLLLPGDEFLLFNVEGLLALTDDLQSPDLDESGSGRILVDDFVAEALRVSESDEPYQELATSFEYQNVEWQADFRRMNIGTQDVMVGTVIPVEALWTDDLFKPAKFFVALLFGVISLLTVLTVRDFRRQTVAPTEEDQLRRLIYGGESADLEFKSSLRWDYREDKINKDLEGVILKSIAAFSNHRGGTLLIGVSDEGEPLGLQPDYTSLKEEGRDYFELHLRNLVISQYGVPFASKGLSVRFVELDGLDICRLDIRRGTSPLYTTSNVRGAPPVEKFFVRSGNSSRAISSMSEATDYIMKRFGKGIRSHS